MNRYAYLNYLLKKQIPDIILRGEDFGRTCRAEIQVYEVVNQGITAKVIVIF